MQDVEWMKTLPLRLFSIQWRLVHGGYVSERRRCRSIVHWALHMTLQEMLSFFTMHKEASDDDRTSLLGQRRKIQTLESNATQSLQKYSKRARCWQSDVKTKDG